MHQHRFVRRAACAVFALSVGVAPFLSTSAAHADEVTDLQSRAAQISGQISDLQAQVQSDTDAVDNANYVKSLIEKKIVTASAQLKAAKRDESTSRKALADYALTAYVNGGSGSVDLAALLNTKGSELGQRQGYQSTAVGNRQELVDQLQASQRITSDRAAALAAQQKQAASVAAQAEAKRSSAEAAQQRLETIHSQLKGRLATLVAERQAAAERARVARIRAETVAAEQKQAQQAAAARTAAAATTKSPAATTVESPATTAAPADTTSPAETTPAATTPSTTTPVATVPSSGAGGRALAAAASQLGVPYVWGAASPGVGFDCSGLTMWAWGQAGVSLSHYTGAQRSEGQVVPISQLQPGDLVFYYGFDHVAMYAGGGTVIHAPHTGDVVKYASLYMSTPILAVRPG